MDTNNTITFAQLGQRLSERAKAASTKSATDVTAVPEKDPQDKGTVSVPVDSAANPAKANVPASASNAGVTPTLPAPAPASTVSGEESPTLSDKIAKVSIGIAGAIAGLRKSASEAAPVNVTPATPPNDKKNTDDKKPCCDTDGKEAAPKETAKDPAAAPAPAPAADSKGAVPADAKNTDTKKASGEVTIDPALYHKFAAELSTSEEGQALMRKIAEAKFGAAIADDLIKASMFMAEQEQVLAEAEASGAFAAEECFKQASAEDQTAIIKLAHVHQAGLSSCQNELEGHFYMEGAKVAAAMMEDPQMMGPGAAGGAPGGAAGGAPGGHDMPEGYDAHGVGDVDIVSVLDQLVQAGKVTPEEAAQALEILQGGQGGEGGAHGGKGPPQDDENAPPEEKEARAIIKQAAAIAAGQTVAPNKK